MGRDIRYNKGWGTKKGKVPRTKMSPPKKHKDSKSSHTKDYSEYDNHGDEFERFYNKKR